MDIKKTYIILFFLSFCVNTWGQWSVDIATIETLIADHKKIRTVLLARSTLEYSNQLLHDYSKKSNVNYKEINNELDKYTRAFDIIDLLVQTVHTACNGYDTYKVVSNTIVSYKDMLEEFHKKCLSRKNIYSTDTLIITINSRMIDKVAKEGDRLIKSLSTMLAYATGAAACTTSDLLMIFNEINRCMDNIKRYLNDAYFNTWKYIQMRTNLWKPSVYMAKPLQEILDNSFDMWMNNTIINK